MGCLGEDRFGLMFVAEPQDVRAYCVEKLRIAERRQMKMYCVAGDQLPADQLSGLFSGLCLATDAWDRS